MNPRGCKHFDTPRCPECKNPSIAQIKAGLHKYNAFWTNAELTAAEEICLKCEKLEKDIPRKIS